MGELIEMVGADKVRSNIQGKGKVRLPPRMFKLGRVGIDF